jgi:general nucleoside transport system permease protein
MQALLEWILPISAATLRVATPLILTAMAGLISERSGVIDIGLEGKLLAGAFAAAAIASVSGSPWLGLAAALCACVGLSLLHGLAVITYRGNQVVAGMAINILIAGLAPTLAFAWFSQAGQTPLLKGEARFSPLTLAGGEVLAQIPLIGPRLAMVYHQVISGHHLLVYVALFCVPATAWLLYQTRFGLRLRAVGQEPGAVDSAGISVNMLRYQAQILAGILTGMAGAYLSTAAGAGFIRDMSAGKGFLALAAMIFGKWQPWPSFFACLLFAFTDAVQIRLQGVSLPYIGPIPVQFIQMLPYGLTVLLLAGFVGKAMAPKALGIAYEKEQR